MKTPANSATRLAEMVAAIEFELAAFDVRRASAAGPGGEEYWAARNAAKQSLISYVEQGGGSARDRWDGARISFSGITVTCTSGLIECAKNWCSKARATMEEAKP
jgi:hypothetical protein